MNPLKEKVDAFNTLYEAFVKECNVLENDGKWNSEHYGDMETWFYNDFLCAILHMIAADGVINMQEVDYLNELLGSTALGFTYTVPELHSVLNEMKEKIDSLFENEITKEYKLLQVLDEQAANDYLDLMVLLCDIISKSDGKIDDAERETAEHLFYLLSQK
ncbi:MAG: TerB family tellurite resistance protein [Lachnospiraceae bacterium]|nr:TerB family tellurite resistance protein [Lachnospiraceae bacterium]